MKNIEKFIERQRLIHPLSDEAVHRLLEEMEEVSFTKNEQAFREGDPERYVWFVKEGLTRAYIERDGKDVTLWFASDGDMVNTVYRETAAYHLEMVEDTSLLRIPVRWMEELLEHSLELSNWNRKLLMRYMEEYEDYFINDSWSEAREQYESLLRTRPDLFRKVPLKHIASFLQITPQSLSRIRASRK